MEMKRSIVLWLHSFPAPAPVDSPACCYLQKQQPASPGVCAPRLVAKPYMGGAWAGGLSWQSNGRVVTGSGCPFSVGLQGLAPAQGTVPQLRTELPAMQAAANQGATLQVLPPCAGLIASCGFGIIPLLAEAGGRMGFRKTRPPAHGLMLRAKRVWGLWLSDTLVPEAVPHAASSASLKRGSACFGKGYGAFDPLTKGMVGI